MVNKFHCVQMRMLLSQRDVRVRSNGHTLSDDNLKITSSKIAVRAQTMTREK